MGRLFALMLGIAIGAAGVFGGLNYHIVRSQDGFDTVPKSNTNFNDVYVDVREFGVNDWAEHKELVEDLVAAKKDHLLGESAEGAVGNSVSRLLGHEVK